MELWTVPLNVSPREEDRIALERAYSRIWDCPEKVALIHPTLRPDPAPPPEKAASAGPTFFHPAQNAYPHIFGRPAAWDKEP